MLDLHAVTGTPGAVTTLGNNFTGIPNGDGQSVAGVPIAPNAVLAMWGGLSTTANTIGALKLQSQDQIDPINGRLYTLGAASLLNAWLAYDKLRYKTGVRSLSMATNTAQATNLGVLIDNYQGGSCIKGSRTMEGQVCSGANTFGGALTSNVWGTMAYAPSTALPNGKYAILGAAVSAITNAAAIRFTHAMFGQFKPGFMVSNYETISTATWDKIPKDDLFNGYVGYQFVALGDKLGIDCCPVFEVTNAGTGLIVEMIDVQADTPVVHLNLAKIG